MKLSMITVVLVCLVVATSMSQADEPDTKPQEAAATASAEKWLNLIDTGKYADSWTEAAALFKNTLTQAEWEQKLNAVRKPLGALVSRNVMSTTSHTSLPDVPDGEYVGIQFKASFTNKEEAVETVTSMKEEDGSWRIIGYFIK